MAILKEFDLEQINNVDYYQSPGAVEYTDCFSAQNP